MFKFSYVSHANVSVRICVHNLCQNSHMVTGGPHNSVLLYHWGSFAFFSKNWSGIDTNDFCTFDLPARFRNRRLLLILTSIAQSWGLHDNFIRPPCRERSAFIHGERTFVSELMNNILEIVCYNHVLLVSKVRFKRVDRLLRGWSCPFRLCIIGRTIFSSLEFSHVLIPVLLVHPWEIEVTNKDGMILKLISLGFVQYLECLFELFDADFGGVHWFKVRGC